MKDAITYSVHFSAIETSCLYLKNLFDSMPRRLQRCHQDRGIHHQVPAKGDVHKMSPVHGQNHRNTELVNLDIHCHQSRPIFRDIPWSVDALQLYRRKNLNFIVRDVFRNIPRYYCGKKTSSWGQVDPSSSPVGGEHLYRWTTDTSVCF